MSLSSTFDLKGIDTGKVGNNKFVDYKLSDYRKDQGFNKRSTDALLGSLNLDRDFLKRVPRTTVMGKIDDFLFKNSRDYYLPTNVTERLAAADKNAATIAAQDAKDLIDSQGDINNFNKKTKSVIEISTNTDIDN